MAKKNPPPDLQSRYQSELDKIKRLKEQLRDLEAKIKTIQSIPEIRNRPRISKAPRPITPIRAGLTSSRKRRSPRKRPSPPSRESGVGKGLRKIKKLNNKKTLLGFRIWKSRQNLASMEVDAAMEGITLPPRGLKTAETVPENKPAPKTDDGRVGKVEQEIRETQPQPSEETATQREPDAQKRSQEKGSESCSQEPFNARKHGIAVGIVVSYYKSGGCDLKILAKGMTNVAHIKYRDGRTPIKRYQDNPEAFTTHLWRKRKRAKEMGIYDSVPQDYYLTYIRNIT